DGRTHPAVRAGAPRGRQADRGVGLCPQPAAERDDVIRRAARRHGAERSHTSAVVSDEPATSVLPSGENATHVRFPLNPSSTFFTFPASTSTSATGAVGFRPKVVCSGTAT